MIRDGILDHVMPPGAGTYMGGTVPAGQTTLLDVLGPVSAGHLWYVERMSAYSTTTQPTPKLEIAVASAPDLPGFYDLRAGQLIPGVWDRISRVDYTTQVANDIADEFTPIYVPEGYYLIAAWSGLTANDWAIVGVQLADHLKDLRITSKQMMRQIHEASTPDTPTHTAHDNGDVPVMASGPAEGDIEIPEPTHDEIGMHRTLDALRDL